LHQQVRVNVAGWPRTTVQIGPKTTVQISRTAISPSPGMPKSKAMMRIRLIALAAVLCLAALPASASAGGPPAHVPGASHAPAGAGAGAGTGSANAPTLEQARAAAAQQCRQFEANFGDSPQQFGKCVAAGTRARRSRITPHQACSGLGLSRKREPGQRRSDFNACVVAAAHGTREGEEKTRVS
jgi:hypothetical protein